jgi:6-phosphogluconate dehydrogenase
MQLGIIGLGRMGGNIARRLMLNGHATVVYDRNEAFVKGLSEEGATGVADLKALVAETAGCLGDVAGRRSHRKHHQ